MKSLVLTSSLVVALFAASLVNANKCVHRPRHSSPGASYVPPVYTGYTTGSAPMTYMTGQPTAPYPTLSTPNATATYGTTSYMVQTSVAASAPGTGTTNLPPNYSATVPLTTIIQNQTTQGCTNSSTCTDATPYSSGPSMTTSTPSPSTTVNTSLAYTTLPVSTTLSIALTSYSAPSIPSYYSVPPAPYTPTADTDNGGNIYSTILAPPIPQPTTFAYTAQYY